MNVSVQPPNIPILSFFGVQKRYGTRTILRDLTFDLPHYTATALLGPNGAGKSTMLRLISGTERPTAGTIRRWGRVSFPLGFNGGWEKHLSGRDNCTFVARIYDRDPKAVCEWVADFSELGRNFDMPVSTYSSGMKQKVAFGLCMALDFDLYLIDEVTAVGDARFQEKCRRAFAERSLSSALVLVSHSVATVRDYCRSAACLIDGELFYFPDVEEGLSEYKAYLDSRERV